MSGKGDRQLEQHHHNDQSISSNQRDFSLSTVHDNFLSCLLDNDDVDMKLYLSAWHELNKFLDTLGTLFQFVTHDIKQKCGILENYTKADEANYHTVNSMVEHEVKTSTTKNKHKASGCRTLLRLHRALNYLIQFFEKLVTAENSTKCSTLSIEAYQATLGKHHTWIIRKAAQLAMYSLPNRAGLLQRIDTSPDAEKNTVTLIQHITQSAQPIYDRIERLYAARNLLDLP